MIQLHTSDKQTIIYNSMFNEPNFSKDQHSKPMKMYMQKFKWEQQHRILFQENGEESGAKRQTCAI